MIDKQTLWTALADIHSKNFRKRSKAMDILSEIGIEEIDTLLPALYDDNSRIREVSLSLLNEILTKQMPEEKDNISDALIKLLDIEDFTPSIEDAAILLGKVGGERAFDVLNTLLETEDEELHESSLEAFGYLKDKRAIPTLLSILPDSDWDKRRAVIWAFGEFRDQSLIPILTNYLDDHSERHELTISQVTKSALEKITKHQVKHD